MNIWRKLIAVCLALTMVLSLLPTAALAADTPAADETTAASTKEITSGTCGDNLTWAYDTDTKTLTITGTGALEVEAMSSPWKDYKLEIEKVVLSDGISRIGNFAFSNCTALTNINIPDSVSSIGGYAFYDCYALTSIDIPDGVTGISYSAFWACRSLTSINIPDSVSSIDFGAFWGCKSLSNIDIPNSVISIGSCAFQGCESLSEINIPESVTSIGESAFSGCYGITSVNIPNKITIIDDGVFSACSALTSVYIPENVTSIGNAAFSNCYALTTINIPESVTNIGTSAFSGCKSLINIKIPDSITNIRAWTFSDCSALSTVDIPDSVTSIGYSAFSNCEALSNLSIPNGLTNIGEFAFENCISLENIYIPNGVTNIGQCAFSGCTALTSIDVPNSVTEVGGRAFYNCTALQDAVIGSGITVIPWKLFSGCSSLTELAIPAGVTDIAYEAFTDCTSLQTVELPQSLELIEHSAFLGDEAISEVIYAGTQAEWETVEVEEENENLTNAHFTFLNNGMVVLNDLVQYVPYQGELGDTYQLKAGAALPEGLALNEAGTAISGVPQVSGTFTVTLIDQEGTEKTLQLVIAKPSDAPEGNKTDAGYEWNNNPPSSIKTGEDLVLISEGDISQFQTVYLDGIELVRDSDYTVEAGSTKLTIHADTLKKVGTGAHTISVAFDAQGVLKTASYTVTVKSSSSGSSSGSSSPSYDLKVSADVENGSVKLSHTSARKGVTVSITVTPDAGYTLGTISAKDEKGNEVALSESDGQYTFTMPGSDVTVSASFIQKVYGVTTDAQVENGAIGLEQASAAAGATVSFTLLPDSGCSVQSVQVVDETGAQVEVQETAGQYSFVMPEGEVHISASFQRVLPFRDVWANQWYWDEICYMYQNNIMNGTSADRFQPESVTTQGMVVTTLYRMAGSPTVDESLLDSATKSAYYALPVAWGREAQMMEQFASVFDPDGVITREQMAVMLYNYVNYMGVSTATAKTDLSEFSDGGATSAFALPAMLWACETGMLQGYNGALRPQGQLTRAELATVLMRLNELVKGKDV